MNKFKAKKMKIGDFVAKSHHLQQNLKFANVSGNLNLPLYNFFTVKKINRI